MCELCPQWVQSKDLTRESRNYIQSNYSRLEEEVGKIIAMCKHLGITRLENGNFYCHQCEKELKLLPN